ncbi:hypothetical protein OAT16_01620 [Prolixibacteraceae bacterium]|nr:hypothetical protein [Prolixibacteraceae bacterium]
MRGFIRALFLLLASVLVVNAEGKKEVDLYFNIGIVQLKRQDQKVASYSFKDRVSAATVGGHIYSNRWLQHYKLDYVGGNMIHKFHDNALNKQSDLIFLRFQATEELSFRLTNVTSGLGVYVGSGLYQNIRASMYNGGDDAFSQEMNYWTFGQSILCVVRKEWDEFEVCFQCNLSLWNLSNESAWNSYYDDEKEFFFHGPSDLVYSHDVSFSWKITKSISLPIGFKYELGNPYDMMSERYHMKQIYLGCRF